MENKSKNDDILMYFIILIITIALASFVLYTKNKKAETDLQIMSLQNEILSLKNKIQILEKSKFVNEEKKSKPILDVTYMEIQLEDKTSSKEGIAYTEPLAIYDEDTINQVVNIVNNAEEYTTFEEEFGSGGYFEGCPIVKFYLKNGETIEITLCDNFAINENDEKINIFGLWTRWDAADKTIYKVNSDFEKFVENIYNENV